MIYILLGFSVLVPVVGQLLFKEVATRSLSAGTFFDPTTAGIFLGAVVLYTVSTVSWVIVLRSLPLSAAYPFFALGFVTTPIAAHFLFGEKLSWSIIIGTTLVVSGLLIILLNNR